MFSHETFWHKKKAKKIIKNSPTPSFDLLIDGYSKFIFDAEIGDCIFHKGALLKYTANYLIVAESMKYFQINIKRLKIFLI